MKRRDERFSVRGFKTKIYLMMFLITMGIVFLATMIMYRASSRSLMNQAANITSTNIELEVEMANTIFHTLEYRSGQIISRDEWREACGDTSPWDYRETAAKYRTLKKELNRYVTNVERNNLIANSIAYSLYFCGRNLLFDFNRTFYENVDSENVPFLENYEENRGHWIATVKADGVNLYHPEFRSRFQERVVSRCFEITDEDGKCIGILAAQVSSSVFENYFSDTQKGLSGETVIVDSSGMPVLYSQKELYEYIAGRETGRENGRLYERVNVNGTPYMLTSQEIENIDSMIYIFVPITKIRMNITTLEKVFLMIVVALLLLCLIFTRVVSGVIYKPIDILNRSMYQVKQGDISTKIRETRKDEFQDIFDTFNSMTDRLESLIQEVAEERLISEKAELRLLQEQLNPHFLYNTLDSIYSIARIYKVQQIADIVAALSRFFRVSLSNGKNFVTLKEATDIARSYLIIQNIRFGGKIHYEIEEDPAMQELIVPKLILQPIVENSIYHGIERKKEGGEIRITITSGDGFCHLIIADNGIGMGEEKLEQIREHLYDDEECQYYAMRNLARQLRLTYRGKEKFSIRSVYREGTVVEIQIPIEEMSEVRDDKADSR